MTARCITHGLRTSRRNCSVVTLLWFWTIALAGTAALPTWYWLGRGFNLAPESDRMLTGFSFMTLGELGQYDRSPVRGILLAAAAAVMLLALLANPLVSGGLMETLIADDGPTTLQRFMRGAGRFFWRFLRLLAYAFVTAGVTLGLLMAAFSPVNKRLSESAWEPATVVGGLVQGALLVAVGGILLLALDFARARLAVNDDRRVLRSWLYGLGLVLRRLPSTLPLLLAPVAIFAFLSGVYLVYVRFTPANAAWLILILFLVQQTLMYCRAFLRVSLVSSVLEYHRMMNPRPETLTAVVETPGPAGNALPGPQST